MTEHSPTPGPRRPEGASDKRPRKASSRTHSSLAGARLLVVDDERLVLSVLRRMLEQAGAVVTATISPREALSLCETAEPSFDLVLTDLVMPELDGIALAKRLRELHPDLPIVFMTGWSNQASKTRPFGPLLTKPFTSAQVLNMLDDTLSA